MNGFLFSIVAFVVAIGILVTVHEFGHFWVARKKKISELSAQLLTKDGLKSLIVPKSICLSMLLGMISKKIPQYF